MASGFDHTEPIDVSSTPDAVLNPPTLPARPASQHGSRATPADHGVPSHLDESLDSSEIQTLFDIVCRAENTLQSLPDTSRLFQASSEIMPQRGVSPSHETRLSEVLFKIGGTREGTNLVEKFVAVMTKMGIELEWGKDEAEPDPVTAPSVRDDQSDDGDHDAADEFSDHDRVDDAEETSSDELDEETTGTAASRSLPFRPKHATDDRDVADDDDKSDPRYDRSATAFDAHRARFAAGSHLRVWRRRVELFRELFESASNAIEKDRRDQRFEDWRRGHRYLHDLGVVARRARYIYVTINILARWRRAARRWTRRARPRSPPPSPPPPPPPPPLPPLAPPDDWYESEDDRILVYLAQRTHENLIKSRVFADWSNRAAEESEKVRIASQAREMSLKSRAFGLKPKWDVLAMALRKRALRPLEMVPSDGVVVDATEPANRESYPARGNTETENSQRELAEESLESAVEGLTEGLDKESVRESVEESTEQLTEAPKAVAEDEGTLLARRHILRLRYFTAWEKYVAMHTAKAQDFAIKRALNPWRGNVALFSDHVMNLGRAHERNMVANALRTWRQQMTEIDGLQRKAQDARHGFRVAGALKAWIAAAREQRRLLRQKIEVFNHWYDQPDRDATLDSYADQFRYRGSMSVGLQKWRRAAKQARKQQSLLAEYGRKADYFQRTSLALRRWMARSREQKHIMSLKAAALQVWRTRSQQEELPHDRQLERYAAKAELFMAVGKVLPTWRDAARKAADQERQHRSYGQRADYYHQSRAAVVAWRAAAKVHKKRWLRDTYVTARQRLKRDMGARCVARWRRTAEATANRYNEMDDSLAEVQLNREWECSVQALGTWHALAQERADLDTMTRSSKVRTRLDQWRAHSADREELRAEADDHRCDRAMSRALKDWNLSSLQRDGRQHTVANVADKRQRRLLRQALETWHAAAADRLLLLVAAPRVQPAPAPPIPPDPRRQSMPGRVQDAQVRASRTLASVHLARWRAAAAATTDGPAPGQPGETATPYRDEPTPGRPRLFLGSLARRPTTTPLAPVPRRPLFRGRDSVLGGSAVEGRLDRTGQPRKANLRVSWAQ